MRYGHEKTEKSTLICRRDRAQKARTREVLLNSTRIALIQAKTQKMDSGSLINCRGSIQSLIGFWSPLTRSRPGKNRAICGSTSAGQFPLPSALTHSACPLHCIVHRVSCLNSDTPHLHCSLTGLQDVRKMQPPRHPPVCLQSGPLTKQCKGTLVPLMQTARMW